MQKLCPSGYVARISRRQNTGYIPGKKVQLICEYIRYYFTVAVNSAEHIRGQTIEDMLQT